MYTKLTTELEAKVTDSADVAFLQDAYLMQTQLRNYDYLTNYVPPFLKEDIHQEEQDPLVCYYYNKLFIYNHTDGAAPVSYTHLATNPSPNFFVTFFKMISDISVAPYSFVYRSAGDFINCKVDDQHQYDDQKIDRISILTRPFLAVRHQDGGECLCLRAGQHYKERELSHAGDKWEEKTGDNTCLLNRDNDFQHAL